MHDPETTEADRIQKILDLKYAPADLDKEVEKIKGISLEQKSKVLTLCKKYEHLFDGQLGNWKTEPVDLILKDPNCTPVYQKPYLVPKSKEMKLKKECEMLVKHGVLRKVNKSEWGMPAFTISKPDGSLRSLADSRKLDKLRRFSMGNFI